jgi:molecular chaperone HtpG
VHLDGILYSSPKVFIRELLQNAVEIITARRSLEPNLHGEIHIQILDGPQSSIVFEGNGIGLTESELIHFLPTIGACTKCEKGAVKDEFIGRFGGS